MAEKMFIHINQGGTLNQADVTGSGKYVNSLVFDENTGKFWAKGRAWNDMDSALNALKYFSSVTGNTGSAAPTASKEGTALSIVGEYTESVSKPSKYVATEVTTSGVIIKTTQKLDDDIAAAAAAGTGASSALETYKKENDPKVSKAQSDATQGISDAAAALAEAQKKVASVDATVNKGIEVVNTDPKNPTVGIKIDETTAGNVTLSVGANGLKANVTIPEAPVKSVAAKDATSAISVSPTTGEVKVGLNLDTSGNVSLSQSATGLKAAIDLSGYVTKEQFEGLKDVFVKEGSVVRGSFGDNGFTENDYGADTALKLVLQNQTAPVYINVASLVDVYDGSKLLLKEISTEATYTAPVANQSVDKAISLLIKGVADAQAKANEAVNKAGVTSINEKTGAITLDTTGTNNGDVVFAISDAGKISGTVKNIKSAAFTEVTAYATADQGAKADSALQEITASGTNYLTLSVADKKVINGSISVQSVSTASSSQRGLAEASDVKKYVDDLWAWEEVTQ